MTISEASTMVDVPTLLTVDEAARVLRIGRKFLASDGTSGIPAVRVGRQLRAPRRALEVFIGATLATVSGDGLDRRVHSPESTAEDHPGTS